MTTATITGYRILQVPVKRLAWRGGVLFLEQELTRCAHGGFSLLGGASRCELLGHGLFRHRQLRFLFEQRTEPEAPSGFEYVVSYVKLKPQPAGDPHLYARDATEMLNRYSRYGYEVTEFLGWRGHWLIVHERPVDGPARSTPRYEAMAVPREQVERSKPAPWPHDRITIAVLATQTHLFPIQVVHTASASQSGE